MKEILEKIIRAGGDILLRHFGKTTKGNDKQYKGDTESDADRQNIVAANPKLHARIMRDIIA